MQFRFTGEQELIRETASGASARWHAFKSALQVIERGEGINAEAWNDLAFTLGFAGIIIPETMNGAGLGAVELACVAEAIGAHLLPIPFVASCGLATAALCHCAPEEAQKLWLPQLAGGTLIATWAHRARGDETNRFKINARGVLSGKASHVLHAAFAGLILVSAINPEGREVIVPLDLRMPGLAITPRISLDLTQPLADIECEAIAVEPGNTFQPDPATIDLALDQARLALAAEQLGAAQAAFDITLSFVGDRVQFGRKIGSFQAVKHRLADRACDIESARSAVYYGAGALDEDHADKADAIAVAAWFAATSFKACVRDMIQFHGGIGFTWEHVAHLYFKRAWSAEKMLGCERRQLEHLADSLAQSGRAIT